MKHHLLIAISVLPLASASPGLTAATFNVVIGTDTVDANPGDGSRAGPCPQRWPGWPDTFRLGDRIRSGAGRGRADLRRKRGVVACEIGSVAGGRTVAVDIAFFFSPTAPGLLEGEATAAAVEPGPNFEEQHGHGQDGNHRRHGPNGPLPALRRTLMT